MILCPGCGAEDKGITVENPEGKCACGYDYLRDEVIKFREVSPGTNPSTIAEPTRLKEQHNG